MPHDITDEVLLARWYRDAGQQDGFVGHWLDLLRKRQNRTVGQQQDEFGAAAPDFIRLQGMPLPRPNQFTRDARRIADLCRLTRPTAFVQALLLARGLVRADAQTGNRADPERGNLAPPSQAYEAAYDEDDNLDEPPDTE